MRHSITNNILFYTSSSLGKSLLFKNSFKKFGYEVFFPEKDSFVILKNSHHFDVKLWYINLSTPQSNIEFSNNKLFSRRDKKNLFFIPLKFIISSKPDSIDHKIFFQRKNFLKILKLREKLKKSFPKLHQKVQYVENNLFIKPNLIWTRHITYLLLTLALLSVAISPLLVLFLPSSILLIAFSVTLIPAAIAMFFFLILTKDILTSPLVHFLCQGSVNKPTWQFNQTFPRNNLFFQSANLKTNSSHYKRPVVSFSL